MSLLVTTSESICKHQTNCSPSKSLFSFPKQPRFKKPLSYNRLSCYGEYSSFSRRKSGRTLDKTTTFGFERPELFYDKEMLNRPTPVTYRIKQNEFTSS